MLRGQMLRAQQQDQGAGFERAAALQAGLPSAALFGAGALLHDLKEIKELNRPILIGASRKHFLGELLSADGIDRPLDQRDEATIALTAMAVQAGAWGVRVHQVRGNRDAVAVVSRWLRKK